jgi:hypothetical protein
MSTLGAAFMAGVCCMAAAEGVILSTTSHIRRRAWKETSAGDRIVKGRHLEGGVQPHHMCQIG